jgi:hypothetical protein
MPSANTDIVCWGRISEEQHWRTTQQTGWRTHSFPSPKPMAAVDRAPAGTRIANPPGERYDPFLDWDFLEALESNRLRAARKRAGRRATCWRTTQRASWWARRRSI